MTITLPDECATHGAVLATWNGTCPWCDCAKPVAVTHEQRTYSITRATEATYLLHLATTKAATDG